MGGTAGVAAKEQHMIGGFEGGHCIGQLGA